MARRYNVKVAWRVLVVVGMVWELPARSKLADAYPEPRSEMLLGMNYSL